jgi:hypothetical protein
MRLLLSVSQTTQVPYDPPLDKRNLAQEPENHETDITHDLQRPYCPHNPQDSFRKLDRRERALSSRFHIFLQALVVFIESLRRRSDMSGQNRAKADGVTDSQIHPLSTGRRMDVGCIPDHKDKTTSPSGTVRAQADQELVGNSGMRYKRLAQTVFEIWMGLAFTVGSDDNCIGLCVSKTFWR